MSIEDEASGVSGEVAQASPVYPAVGSARRAQWAFYVTWVGYALLAFGVALRLRSVSAPELDYDEGVYWQSLRAMANGHPLFSSVFSSQPPAFLYGIYPFYLTQGHSIVGARLGEVLYSLVGIVATYFIGRYLAGHWAGFAGAVLLSVDALYLWQSYSLEAEMPSLCWSLVGIALALAAYRSTGTRRRWLAFAAGIALAVGIGAKLFGVVAVIPAAMYLAAPLGGAFLDGAGRLRRPDARRLGQSVRTAMPDVLFLLAGLGLGLVVIIAPFAHVWPSLYDQVIGFHLRASQLVSNGYRYNLTLIRSVGSENPLEVAALVAIGVAAWQRMWYVLPIVVWLLLSFALLEKQQPLFSHHVVLLAPPLAILVAVVALSVSGRAALPRGSSAVLERTHMPSWLPTCALVVVTALAVWGVIASSDNLVLLPTASPHQIAMADLLEATTQPGDYVLTDNQFVAAMADRDVPPQLVDTSDVRIRSGYLTLTQLEQAAQDSNVRAVLFASGRFDEVPGFREWVASHFTKVADFGGGVTLYVKAPQTPVAA